MRQVCAAVTPARLYPSVLLAALIPPQIPCRQARAIKSPRWVLLGRWVPGSRVAAPGSPAQTYPSRAMTKRGSNLKRYWFLTAVGSLTMPMFMLWKKKLQFFCEKKRGLTEELLFHPRPLRNPDSCSRPTDKTLTWVWNFLISHGRVLESCLWPLPNELF